MLKRTAILRYLGYFQQRFCDEGSHRMLLSFRVQVCFPNILEFPWPFVRGGLLSLGAVITCICPSIYQLWHTQESRRPGRRN